MFKIYPKLTLENVRFIKGYSGETNFMAKIGLKIPLRKR